MRTPFFLLPIWPPAIGGRGTTCGLVCSPLMAHMVHIFLPGVPVTPRYSGICPILPKTIPVSEHSRPICQSLCLDHFETPRYVRDQYIYMTETRLRSITNSGTWMLILAPTYSMKIFYRSDRIKIFVEYVGTNMSIQVPLLVIDRK